MTERSDIQDALDKGHGILRLEPCWVPRSFMHPGRRLRLHPDDLYAFGAHRGGINERWFSSTTNADNGPGTPADEGLSYVRHARRKRFLLKEAVEQAGDLLLGATTWRAKRAGTCSASSSTTWARFRTTCTRATSTRRASGGAASPRPITFRRSTTRPTTTIPYTFMGLEPGTTKDDVRRCLENWNKGDNGITYLSRAYRLERGTSWQIDPGILHAPGSLLTYEPQVNSDVFAMFQSQVEGRIDAVGAARQGRAAGQAAAISTTSSGCSTGTRTSNPRFGESNRYVPAPVEAVRRDGRRRIPREWVICTERRWYSAKELTVLPKRTVTIKDAAAYGIILTQGYGTFGGLQVSTPAMIRFGQMTEDELFVSAEAARAGVKIENRSEHDPLVILKHFGPGNPDAPKR